MTAEEIQEICKIKYPIGVKYICALAGNFGNTEILEDDKDTYRIYPCGDYFQIWAHTGGGILYDSNYKLWAKTDYNPPKVKVKRASTNYKKVLVKLFKEANLI